MHEFPQCQNVLIDQNVPNPKIAGMVNDRWVEYSILVQNVHGDSEDQQREKYQNHEILYVEEGLLEELDEKCRFFEESEPVEELK